MSIIKDELKEFESLAGSANKCCNYLEKLEQVSDKILTAWQLAYFSDVPEHTLNRYFQYHLEGIRKISDALFQHLQHQSTGSPEQRTLLMLIEKIMDNFFPYFSMESRAPKVYHLKTLTAMSDSLTHMNDQLAKLDIDRELRTILLEYMQEMTAKENLGQYNFRSILYFEKIVYAVRRMEPAHPSVENDGRLIDILTSLNFNHLWLLTHKQQLIEKQTKAMTLSGKLETLRAESQKLQWLPEQYDVYSPTWPSLNKMLSAWLQEQINRTLASLQLEAVAFTEIEKLPLNFSVAQLACLLRMCFEEGFFQPVSLTTIFKFVSCNYATKRQSSISPGSLSKEYYGISQVTAATVRDLLQKMVTRINHAFFPVWAATGVIIDVLLKRH